MRMSEQELEAAMRNSYLKLEKLSQLRIKLWTEEAIYHSEFWFSVGMSIIPWLIWWRFRKKDSTDRLLYAGFVVMLITIVLDQIGSSFGWWYYIYEADPIMPAYLPWNSALVPVTIMFMLQWKPWWHALKKAVIYAMLTAFLGDSFFAWQGNYVPLTWNAYMSLPLYALLYLLAHYLFYKRSSFAGMNRSYNQK